MAEGDKTPDDAELLRTLTPAQYAVTRLRATEPPFSGELLNHHEEGTYECVCCGQTLFKSDAKYDSGSGWPSFVEPASDESVSTRSDTSHDMNRTEVICSRCDAHLGHVFDDGPAPAGRRYCINSLAMRFSCAQPQQGLSESSNQ